MKIGDILICKKDNVYCNLLFAFLGQRFEIILVNKGDKSLSIKCIDYSHPHYKDLQDINSIWYYQNKNKNHRGDIEYIWKFFITQKGKARKIRKVAKDFLK